MPLVRDAEQLVELSLSLSHRRKVASCVKVRVMEAPQQILSSEPKSKKMDSSSWSLLLSVKEQRAQCEQETVVVLTTTPKAQ